MDVTMSSALHRSDNVGEAEAMSSLSVHPSSVCQAASSVRLFPSRLPLPFHPTVVVRTSMLSVTFQFLTRCSTIYMVKASPIFIRCLFIRCVKLLFETGTFLGQIMNTSIPARPSNSINVTDIESLLDAAQFWKEKMIFVEEFIDLPNTDIS